MAWAGGVPWVGGCCERGHTACKVTPLQEQCPHGRQGDIMGRGCHGCGQEHVVAEGWHGHGGCCGRGMPRAGEWRGQGNGVGRGMSWKGDARDRGMLRAGDATDKGMLWAGDATAGKALAGAAHGRYLWFPPSQRSHRRCLQARRSAQVAGRSGPRARSAWQAWGERGRGMWCQPSQQRGMAVTGARLLTSPASASPAGTRRGRRRSVRWGLSAGRGPQGQGP